MTYYPIQSHTKGEDLLPLEAEVQDALLRDGYTCDPDGNWEFFTPTEELYQVYLRYVQGMSWRNVQGVLNRQQFGVALRRVWGWDYKEPGYATTRRRIEGKRVCGVYHLNGPATIRVIDGHGRRPDDHDPFPE